MSAGIRFEEEAGTEYREAGRWYESRRPGLGLEFFDAVDATLRKITDLPHAGEVVPRIPRELPVRRLAVKRFPYQKCQRRSAFSPLRTTAENPVTGRVVLPKFAASLQLSA